MLVYIGHISLLRTGNITTDQVTMESFTIFVRNKSVKETQNQSEISDIHLYRLV